MGGWGVERGGLRSKDDCKKFVRAFCENEDADVKDVTYFDQEFKSAEEALAYASGKESKWENAIAVSYLGLPTEIKKTATSKKLEVLKGEALPAKSKEISAQLTTLGEVRMSAEVTLVKCEACTSKINSKHLVGFDSHNLNRMVEAGEAPSYGCPACKEKGIVPTFLKVEMKKLNKLLEQFAALKEKRKELETKVADENVKEKFWAVSCSIPT